VLFTSVGHRCEGRLKESLENGIDSFSSDWNLPAFPPLGLPSAPPFNLPLLGEQLNPSIRGRISGLSSFLTFPRGGTLMRISLFRGCCDSFDVNEPPYTRPRRTPYFSFSSLRASESFSSRQAIQLIRRADMCVFSSSSPRISSSLKRLCLPFFISFPGRRFFLGRPSLSLRRPHRVEPGSFPVDNEPSVS